MNYLSTHQSEALPSLIDRAATALSGARDSAEVLEARDLARVAYDAAKSAGRIARAKKAHDEVLSAVYRAQADALLIEARAKSKLADEYDAAQERGEVAGHGGGKSNLEKAKVNDLQLRYDEIHEARQIRNIERDNPGLIERTLNEMVERGEEPTKAALKAANYRTVTTGENEWYTPTLYVEMARTVMGGIDLDPASCAEANETVGADHFFTKEDDGLTLSWYGRVWLNPPYSRDLMPAFVDKLKQEFAFGDVSQAIMVSHNNTDTAWFHSISEAAAAVCFPKKRIKFYRGDDIAAPVNGQMFIYLGPRVSEFHMAFSEIGCVWLPA